MQEKEITFFCEFITWIVRNVAFYSIPFYCFCLLRRRTMFLQQATDSFITLKSVSQRSAYWLPFISSMAINPKCSSSSFMPWEPLKKMNSILCRAITTALPASECFQLLWAFIAIEDNNEPRKIGFRTFQHTGQKLKISLFSSSYCLISIPSDFLLNFLKILAEVYLRECVCRSCVKVVEWFFMVIL